MWEILFYRWRKYKGHERKTNVDAWGEIKKREWKWLVSNPGKRLISSSQQINNFLPNTTKISHLDASKQTNKQTNKYLLIKIIGHLIMISFYNSVFLAFDRIHIFCCDQNSMSVCGRKIYDDNCDLFLASRDFKCKERNWEFTKVHEGGPRPGHLHFTLFNRFKTVLLAPSGALVVIMV